MVWGGNNMRLQAFIEEKITKYRVALAGLTLFVGTMVAMTGGAAACSFSSSNSYSNNNYNSSPCHHRVYKQESRSDCNRNKCERYFKSSCKHSGCNNYNSGCQHSNPCD
jgi:hypothetical protein